LLNNTIISFVSFWFGAQYKNQLKPQINVVRMNIPLMAQLV